MIAQAIFEGWAARFVPWRFRMPLESAAIATCRFRDAPEVIDIQPGSATAVIAAAGDIALHSFGAEEIERRGRVGAAMAQLFDGADLTVANIESVFTDREEKVGRRGAFLRASPKSVDIVQLAGLDVATCANNHCLDYGPAALQESVQLLRSIGMDVCGTGESPDAARRPVIRLVNGIRVGLLAYTDDWRPAAGMGFQPAGSIDAEIVADICALEPLVDIVVVQLHWGWEWAVHPLLSQRDRARHFAESGADLVLCHHAHVPMAVEPWGKSLIAHGLGNFVFPWRGKSGRPPAHRWLNRSYVLRVGISASGVHAARIVPVEYSAGMLKASTGWARREMLGALSLLRRGLNDRRRLGMMEQERIVRQGIEIGRRLLEEAIADDIERLEETITLLTTPRSVMLVEGLRSLPNDSGSLLAEILCAAVDVGPRALRSAIEDGRMKAFDRRLTNSGYPFKFLPGRTP